MLCIISRCSLYSPYFSLVLVQEHSTGGSPEQVQAGVVPSGPVPAFCSPQQAQGDVNMSTATAATAAGFQGDLGLSMESNINLADVLNPAGWSSDPGVGQGMESIQELLDYYTHE